MEMILIVANYAGVLIYVVTAIASSVNMAVLYARGEAAHVWLREFLWALIAMFQLIGLVLINAGSPDPRLWLINRFFWLLFSVCVSLMAWQSVFSAQKIAWRERRQATDGAA
jgi:hypothetical protein